MDKYIFLDVDGVVNSRFSMGLELLDDGLSAFDDQCVKRLEQIVEGAGVDVTKIVISSSWRRDDLMYIKMVFMKRGFKYWENIIGETIRGYNLVQKGAHLPIPRGVEIKAWIDKKIRYVEGKGFIKKHKVDFTCVILDDNSDMLLEQAQCFVQTESTPGLQDHDVEKAIKILNLI